MKEELIEERDKFERERRELEQVKDQERENAIKGLTLEHELELDSVRHKLEISEKSAKNETELAKMKEELMMKESDIEALRRKTRLLESAEKERFNCEKEKIVQVITLIEFQSFLNQSFKWATYLVYLSLWNSTGCLLVFNYTSSILKAVYFKIIKTHAIITSR